MQNDGNGIVGLNYKESKLVFIDSNLSIKGNFPINSYIKGKNPIMYFDVNQNNIDIFDFNQQTLKSYNKNSSNLLASNRINHSSKIFRITKLDASEYLFAEDIDSTDLRFVVYDRNDKKVKSIFSLNNILTDRNSLKYPSMIYDGRFLSSHDDTQIIYYCNFTGVFISFSKLNRGVNYYAKTIDKTPPPIATNTQIAPGYKSLEIKPNTMFFNSGSINHGYLYLLNFINANNDPIVDKYDLNQKGKYLESILIPKMKIGGNPQSILIKNQIIYIIYENYSIAKFQIIT